MNAVAARLVSDFGFETTQAEALSLTRGFSEADLDAWSVFFEQTNAGAADLAIRDPAAYTASLMKRYRNPSQAGKPWYKAKRAKPTRRARYESPTVAGTTIPKTNTEPTPRLAEFERVTGRPLPEFAQNLMRSKE